MLLSSTTLAGPGRATAAVDEHDCIVAAIEARDETAAQLAAEAHISNAYRMRLKLARDE